MMFLSNKTSARFSLHQTNRRRFFLCKAGRSAVVPEDGVELLGDSDEGRPAAQLLQLGCTDIRAGGADPSQDVSYGVAHRTFVENFHGLSLRRSGGNENE